LSIDDFPRDWDIESESHKLYEQLTDKNQTISPFRGKTFAELFIYAMALGFHHKSRIPIKKKMSSIPFSALRDREWLVKAIAVAETGSLDILLDKPTVALIAQEYANGGIVYLRDMVFGAEPGDAYKRMESELREIVTSIA
jgi:dnd system-associated protein 4